jgi:hypothetical protein
MKQEIKYYYDIEQNSNAWFEARLGVVTASNINLLLTPKGEPAKNAKVRDYAYKLVGERLTWRMDYEYQGFDMERGHIQEGIARDIYSRSYEEVRLCGFVMNTMHGFKLGASPDGIVGDEGGIEIKSRLTKFQIQTVTEDVIDTDYINQIQANLLVTGRKWWDFVQYSNGMPLYVKRVLPDAVRQASIIEAVRQFEETCKEISTRYELNVKKFVPTSFIENLMGDEIEASE